MRLGGVVLCGGLSTRMGKSKAMLPFAKSTMLGCVIERLTEVTLDLVVVAAQQQELPTLPPGVVLVQDEREHRGPLEGIRVGLAALERHCEAAYVTSCDAPLLVPAVVSYLASQLAEAEAVVPSLQGRLHPLSAVYRTSLTTLAERLLEQGESRLTTLSLACSANIFDAELLRSLDPNLQTLRNLNTPEEYEAAIREYRS